MKLSAIQIKKIDDSLKKQGLFYEDVRSELVDHIASGFEDKGIDHYSFNDALAQCINSHEMVKLLTAAKRREKFKDKQHHKAFLRELASMRGIAILAAVTIAIWQLGKISWASDLILMGFLIVMLWTMFGLNGMESGRQTFMKRIYGQVKIYYLTGVVILALAGHFYKGTDIFNYAKTIILSFAFTGYYSIYMVNHKFKTTQYV